MLFVARISAISLRVVQKGMQLECPYPRFEEMKEQQQYPIILNLGSRRRRVVHFRTLLLYPLERIPVRIE
jgi:hypothetical protein